LLKTEPRIKREIGCTHGKPVGQSSVVKKKRNAGGLAKIEDFKPGMKE